MMHLQVTSNILFHPVADSKKLIASKQLVLSYLHHQHLEVVKVACEEVGDGGGRFLRFSFCGEIENAQVPCCLALVALPPHFDFLGLLLLISLNVEMTTMKFWARTYSNNIDVIGFEHQLGVQELSSQVK